MLTFEELPEHNQRLILAKLRSELHAHRASSIYHLAKTKKSAVMDTWKGICIRAGQPLCAPPISFDADEPAPRSPHHDIDQARDDFGKIFQAARSGPVSRADVDNAAVNVMAAVGDGGIQRWLKVVWTYDDATFQHCLLVTGLAAEFASALRFSVNDQRHLVRGALVHDVGKARIPLQILNKPGKLDDRELQTMRAHPRIGYDLLRAQGDYESELLEVVLWHHEMLDGSGYPDGIGGGQIGDLVRLVTICDIYAALIERRSYKQPMEPRKAFSILQDMGQKLEGALVLAFSGVSEKSALVPA